MCICGVARDTKKSPHVRTATNESEEELVLGEYFSRSPFTFCCFGKDTITSRNQNNKHQHATTMRDDEHD